MFLFSAGMIHIASLLSCYATFQKGKRPNMDGRRPAAAMTKGAHVSCVNTVTNTELDLFYPSFRSDLVTDLFV